MLKYVRIKAWFLQKSGKFAYCTNDRINGYKFTEYNKFLVKKETEKALLINANGDLWCPKSAIIDIEESEFTPMQNNHSADWKEMHLCTKDMTKDELKVNYENAKKDFRAIAQSHGLDEAMDSQEYKYMDFLAKLIKQ